MWIAALCALLLIGWGCGKKGDPIPPEKPKSRGTGAFQVLITS